MKTRFLVALLLLILAAGLSFPQEISELEFQNQRLSDILAVLADVANVSVIPDATVTGTASYYFSETNFDDAFRNFLDAFNLFAEFRDGTFHVSRIRIQYAPEGEVLSVEANDVELRLIIDSVSREIGKTILYDPLPTETVTINAQSIPVATVLEILTRRLADFTVSDEGDYYYVQRTPRDAVPASEVRAVPQVTRDGDLFGFSVVSARASDLLAELFEAAEVEYVSFSQSDSIVQNLVVSPRPFESALRLVLDQAAMDVTRADGVYVLLDLQRRDVLKRFQTVRVVQLRHLGVAEFPNLLPPDLSGADLYRIDQAGNRLVLSGSPQEIEPLLAFIETIDQVNPDLSYHRFDLNYAAVEDVLQTLPPRFSGENPRVVPDTNSFVVVLTDQLAFELSAYLAVVDRPRQSVPIHLRYIRSQDLLDNLPPSIETSSLVPSTDPSLLFFTGTDAQRDFFLRELELIDRPVPQIQYQLLVIQFQQGQGQTYSLDFENSAIENGLPFDATVLGALGQLLSLNFDIVSTFGYQFALKLNADLSNNDARVMADTTLNAISGQEVRFQNTNTFRYRDPVIDPDTGLSEPTGAIREITSGLIISINGWTSGDGMITMDIAATVSNQVSSASTTSGNLPPTSERIVNTHVRTETGEPIVIGGLIQQNSDEVANRTPLFSRIPVIGRLFERDIRSVENTELVIYVIPHATRGADSTSEDHYRIQDMYNRLIRGRIATP